MNGNGVMKAKVSSSEMKAPHVSYGRSCVALSGTMAPGTSSARIEIRMPRDEDMTAVRAMATK